MDSMRVSTEDLEELLAENRRLSERVQELLDSLHREVEKRRAADRRASVAEFHRAASIPILNTLQVPPDDRVRLRLRLITEEYFELLEASGLDIDPASKLHHAHELIADSLRLSPPSVLLPDFVDALADLDYVIEGTRLEFGVDGAPVFAEVHRANMAKFSEGWSLRPDGKVLKPPNWTPPDIVGVLAKQGWNP